MTPKSRPLGRSSANKPLRRRLLLYVEGDQTEMIYFKGIRSTLRDSGIVIEFGGAHGEPLGLVREAIAHRKRDREFDQVWCVFDIEAPEPHSSFDAAVTLARRNDVLCAISSPCFELWLLLHFGDPPGYLTSKQAQSRLEGQPCGYSARGKTLNHKHVHPHTAVAVGRAARLDAEHAANPKLTSRNPWTSVHLLVEELNRKS